MNKKLRLRFINDLKYPITVIEDPYFKYQLSLCPGAIEDWEKLKKGINEEYKGNAEEFLKDFYAIRESMVQTLGNSEKWKEANIDSFVVPDISARSKDIYNQEYADKNRIFMSIDLKKANLQAFCKIDPSLFGWEDHDIEEVYFADLLWKNFIVRHVPKEKKILRWYVYKSKYIRQVIFGNCNPKKQIKIEKWMVWEQTKKVLEVYPEAQVLMFGSDEVVLEFPSLPTKLIPRVPEIDTSIKVFSLESIPFLTASGVTIRIYKRVFLGKEGYDYKCIPKNYYAQIYNLIEGEGKGDPEGKDLVFYYEKEIAKFVERLKRG